MGELPDIFQSNLTNDLNNLSRAPGDTRSVLRGLIALIQLKGSLQKARNAIKDRENDLETDYSVNELCQKIEFLSLGLETYFKNQRASEPMNIDKRTAEAIAACLDEKIGDLKVKWDYLSGGWGIRPKP
jgi:hypothetical protein